MTFTDRIQQAQELCEKATKGPWRARKRRDNDWAITRRDDSYPHQDMEAPIASFVGDGSNANLTVAARTLLPWLLRVLSRAVEVIRRLKLRLRVENLRARSAEHLWNESHQRALAAQSTLAARDAEIERLKREQETLNGMYQRLSKDVGLKDAACANSHQRASKAEKERDELRKELDAALIQICDSCDNRGDYYGDEGERYECHHSSCDTSGGKKILDGLNAEIERLKQRWAECEARHERIIGSKTWDGLTDEQRTERIAHWRKAHEDAQP